MCLRHNIVMPGSKPSKSTSTIGSKLQQVESPKTETGADSLNHPTALSDIKTSLDTLKNVPFDLANLRQSIGAIISQFGLLRADALEIKQKNVKLKKSNKNLKAFVQKQKMKIKDLEKSREFVNEQFEQTKDMLKNPKEDNSKLLSNMKMEFEKQISKIENNYEHFEQYNRRDNLKLHGVPQTAQENTNQVIIKVLASVNYKLDEKYISCSNRLPTRGKIPCIIVKFNHRDIRNSVYPVKSQLRHVDWSATDLPEATKKIFITNNLTAARKDLYFETLVRSKNPLEL